MILGIQKPFLCAIIFHVGLYSVIGQFILRQTYPFDLVCGNRPNFTALSEATGNQTLESHNLYTRCRNETETFFKLTLSRNATRLERRGCRLKCYAKAEGIIDQHDNLKKETIRQKIKLLYSFSNATAKYIAKVSDIFASCVGIAETSFQRLKSNGTLEVGECEIFNLYDNCVFSEWDSPQYTLENFQTKYCSEPMETKTQ